jgi:hypothetical protein
MSPFSLRVTNLDTGEVVPAVANNFTYDHATNTVTFAFPWYTNSVLPTGRYEALFYGSNLDNFGNPIGEHYTFTFTVRPRPIANDNVPKTQEPVLNSGPGGPDFMRFRYGGFDKFNDVNDLIEHLTETTV